MLNIRWMSLAQAKGYCNINKRKLVELIQAGKLKGGQHKDKGNNDWFIDRLSIDSYMEAMTINTKAQEKAFEILKKVM